jgi:hypothetical protein
MNEVKLPVMKWIGRSLLVLLALFGLGLALSWAPDQPVSALAPRWAPPPSQFVAVAGLQVHLRDERLLDRDLRPLRHRHARFAAGQAGDHRRQLAGRPGCLGYRGGPS